MKRLFLQLTMANLALLLGVTVWGHFLSTEPDAMSRFDILAVLVTIFCALIHSVIYTYFIATCKFVERAVEEHGYEPATAKEETKKNKLRSFRYAFLAMFSVMIACFLYFWSSPVRQEFAIARGWATIAGYLAIILNIYAAKIEWKYIVANGVITDDILAQISEPLPVTGGNSSGGAAKSDVASSK